ncbi:MAG: NUDIX domain-containing protein [Leptospiraceae bacterium]|nr:NUDIX domain-containing protein [Leptospiraceae bacterium]
MPRVRVSAKALIVRQNQVLAIENHGPELFYTLPGGGQHYGENLIQTIERECREELNRAVAADAVDFHRDHSR